MALVCGIWGDAEFDPYSRMLARKTGELPPDDGRFRADRAA
jgi:hypothetical protein